MSKEIIREITIKEYDENNNVSIKKCYYGMSFDSVDIWEYKYDDNNNVTEEKHYMLPDQEQYAKYFGETESYKNYIKENKENE